MLLWTQHILVLIDLRLTLCLGESKRGVHYDKLITCVPLHCFVGKDSKDVFRWDMGKFCAFAERMRYKCLVVMHTGEPMLKPFHIIPPKEMFAE